MQTDGNKHTATVLTVDVGNSQTQFGLFRGEELTASWKIVTRRYLTSDEARLALEGFFSVLERDMQNDLSAGGDTEAGSDDDGKRATGNDRDSIRPEDAILSCVVPDLTDIWATALLAECGRKPFVVGPGLKTGIKMLYNDPSEIGSDRVADIVAAKALYGSPLVVVDVGTTTNFEVIDRNGAHAGGLIAPGLELSAKTVSQAAAKLPIVELKVPASIIGKSTREAMQAGLVMGEVARIDGLISMIWDELGYETPVIVTGDDAASLAALSSRIERADGTLILTGLKMLYDMNTSR